MRAARFTGIGTFMRLPNVTDMADVDAAFIGIPFDTAVSYRIGGRFGPSAIREASRLLRPYNVEQGIEIFEHVSAVDAGDVAVIFVDELTVNLAALVEPNLTAVAPVRLVPVIVTEVPPVVGPSLGVTLVTVGPVGAASRCRHLLPSLLHSCWYQ